MSVLWMAASSWRMVRALVPDRSDRQLALGDAEGCFGFAELDVGSPQRLGRPVLDVGAQHVAALAVARPVVPLGPDRPVEAQAGGQGGILDQADRITSGGARIAAQQPSDLTLGGAAIDRVACSREPSVETSQSGFDALAEARVHGAFLPLALGRAHQQEGFAALGAGTQLGLDPVAHLPPVARVDELRRERLQLALVRPDQILPLAALQPGDRFRAGHAAIHHPDPLLLAIAALHRADDLLYRRHVGAVAGEHLVPQRHAVAR